MGRQIGPGRERHKTVKEWEKEIVISLFPNVPYFTLLCFLPPSLILPHPPLLSSILMLGLGGLTCLVIDGNVSGSHFPQQHPAAFHQAWSRGEPITWMLLTLCSLHPGLSDHLSPSILDSIPTTTLEPPTSTVTGSRKGGCWIFFFSDQQNYLPKNILS